MGTAEKHDPQYVQIRKGEAARILGRSLKKFDELRANDPAFPKGVKDGTARSAPVYFRLSDIYAYSEKLMQR